MVFSLPEGLLKTNPEIYAVLERYPVIPAEDMIRCSNVYSTLHHIFDDSTSARAKNFWRRVEGQQLSGPAVAKLLKEFLSSPTFDPLKRAKGQDDDEPSAPKNHQQEPLDEVDAESPKESSHEMDPNPPEQPKEGESLGCSSPTTNTKPPTPRSAPPRSILKKNQGPSALEAQYADPITPEPAAPPPEAMLEAEAKRKAELAAQRTAQTAADLQAELAMPSERTQGEASSSQRRVSFLDDKLPGTEPPRESTPRDTSTLDFDAASSTTTQNMSVTPVDRFGPRVGYIPQRVERSGLLLTERVVNGSGPN